MDLDRDRPRFRERLFRRPELANGPQFTNHPDRAAGACGTRCVVVTNADGYFRDFDIEAGTRCQKFAIESESVAAEPWYEHVCDACGHAFEAGLCVVLTDWQKSASDPAKDATLKPTTIGVAEVPWAKLYQAIGMFAGRNRDTCTSKQRVGDPRDVIEAVSEVDVGENAILALRREQSDSYGVSFSLIRRVVEYPDPRVRVLIQQAIQAFFRAVGATIANKDHFPGFRSA